MVHPANTTANPAALPWYDFASTRHVLDRVWGETGSLLRAAGISDIPDTLDHTQPHADLLAYPQLTLSQCCGLDLFQPQTSKVEPFAAPLITALDVAPGQYFSHIAARPAADLRAPRVVINHRFSHSGHTAIKGWLHANGCKRYTISVSGSHAQSLQALRSGRADIAAIDALSWLHLDTGGVTIIGASDPAPAPPFIIGCESKIPPAALTAALNTALQRHGAALGIGGAVAVERHHYADIAARAREHGVLDQ